MQNIFCDKLQDEFDGQGHRSKVNVAMLKDVVRIFRCIWRFSFEIVHLPSCAIRKGQWGMTQEGHKHSVFIFFFTPCISNRCASFSDTVLLTFLVKRTCGPEFEPTMRGVSKHMRYLSDNLESCKTTKD